MGNATAFLKKKGPLGMPMAFWVAFAAIVLYLGYRWYKNRSGSSSSSSSTDTTGTDTTGASPSDTIPGGEIDTTEPPTSTTAPVQTQPLEPSGGSGITVPETGGKKTKHKKKERKKRVHHASPNDHRQGSTHTSHRSLPKPKARNHHAPPTQKRPHSKDKAQTVRNVRAGGSPPKVLGTKSAAPSPSPKSHVAKSLPAHPQVEKGAEKTRKAPPTKQSNVRKAA